MTERSTYTGGTCYFTSLTFLRGSYWNITVCTRQCFFGSCSFQAELPLSFMVAVVTILWPFAQTFSKHSSTELRYILRHFPADFCLKFGYNIKRRYSTLYFSRGMLLYQWKRELHLLAANQMIHSTSLLSSSSKFTLGFANRSIDHKWTRNKAWSLVARFPWLNRLWLLFVGKLKRWSIYNKSN
jgi:hypothetical protein